MRRWWIVLAGVSGVLAVGLGAFGAHGLEGLLEGSEDLSKRLDWWKTAVSYHLLHTVALLAVGALRGMQLPPKGTSVAAGAFSVGMLLFSGTLYAMALGAPRWFGAITPLGGLSLMVGWAAIATAGARRIASGV